MNYDFSGYATRADTKCSDGRTIKPNAFKSDDGKQVPLCWQHGHSDISNVLGHAVLENREDGVYAYCKFNETPSGQQGQALVKHGDVVSLSIYANQLVERGKDVIHGVIREVSLVLAGANPGALIDNVILAHNGIEDIVDEEAVIYSGEEIEVLEHSEDDEDISHASPEDDPDNDGSFERFEVPLIWVDGMIKEIDTAKLEKMMKDLEDDPDFEHSDLAHYGVKGMKWGVRKADKSGGGSSRRGSGKLGKAADVVGMAFKYNTFTAMEMVVKANLKTAAEREAIRVKYKDDLKGVWDLRNPKAKNYLREVNDSYNKALNEVAADMGMSKTKRGNYNVTFDHDMSGHDSAYPRMYMTPAKEDDVKHAATDTDERTLQDVFDDMTEEQKNLVIYVMNQIPTENDSDEDEASAEHGDTTGEVLAASESTITTDNAESAEEGNTMSHNIFEGTDTKNSGATLSHSDMKGIFEDFKKMGSLKDAVEKYALQHGIENIDLLFPDAQAVTNTPDFVKRQTEWVADVMSGTRHTPFSRIKSLTADLTVEEARAKGYIKGNMKKEEFFALAKRVTTPQTVYKKQKLDRDDIIDITDFDVVTWLKAEMRLMLNEEIARAILVGDGRSNADDDKIKEDNIRPILTDAELYVTKVYAKVTGDSAKDVVNSAVRYRRHYKGSGNPIFFTSEDTLAALLLEEDTIGRRLYQSVSDLQAAMRVSKIVAVEVFDEYPELLGIMVNLNDYVVGSDKGGAISLFDDFDIDYNQFKYLIETRLSGALVKPKSAVVIMRADSGDTLVAPVEPDFDPATGAITIPTVTGVTYESPKGTTVTAASSLTVAEGSTNTVYALPATGYYFATNAGDEWAFTRA